jgi:hypothetical protein
MLDEDQQTALDLAKDGHNLVVIVQGSFATGGSCKKSPAKTTRKFPNKTDELLTF